ncbi:MAG: serine/threonine-protein kinase [Acidobacteriota bacterium]
MIGTVLGNYKITDKIGEGGMGAVFRGLDEMLEREVAIKMLRPELARQPDVVERFRSEAVTLAKLNHPNIATLYSFLRHGDDYFMVMEYVRGNTLEAIIRNFGAISYERAIPLFCQALEGIDHAHKQGIVHRDIKPANVMVLETGSVKVMDFGIARMLGSARLTRQGNVVGTIEYMSPEQIKGEETDARSDIYSLGMLLYEMLTGRLPFESTSEYELMRFQVEEAPPPPTTHSANIPPQIEQAIMRALAKKRDARYQTAGEFRAVLLRTLVASTSQFGTASTGNYAAPATRIVTTDERAAKLSADRAAAIPPNTGEKVADSRTPSMETRVDRALQTPAIQPPTGEVETTRVLGVANAPGEKEALPATQVFGGKVEANLAPPATQVVSFNPPAKPLENQAVQKFQAVEPQAVAANVTAATGSKSNWKMFAGVGVIILALVGASAAFFLKRNNATPQSPAVEQAPTETVGEPANSEQPPTNTEVENQTPTNSDGTLEGEENANSNSSKQAKQKKADKTEQPAEGTDEAKTEEPAQPTTQPQQQPATTTQQPKQEPTTTVAKEPEKKEEKKEEKKKGGIGGFFKKIFGGGDKKKEEKKPPQN